MILSKINDLCSSVRHERTNQSSQLTLYSKFMIDGAPIVIEKALYVNDFVRLPALRPKQIPCTSTRISDVREISLHTHCLHYACIVVKRGRTSDELVSRSGYYSSLTLFSGFPQTTPADISNL